MSYQTKLPLFVIPPGGKNLTKDLALLGFAQYKTILSIPIWY